MRRLYHLLANKHFEKYRQMFFLAGPRQVGKTTLGHSLGKEAEQFSYFGWDNDTHRELITEGPDAVAMAARLSSDRKPLLMFDEIYRYSHWKRFLKGFYDTHPDQAKIFVTGSARLDIYQRGADSLMGRYFLYRMHPLSVGELCQPNELPKEPHSEPTLLDPDAFDALWRFGGFPQPFLAGEEEFYNIWKRQRYRTLFREDLRELSRVQQIDQVEMLAEFLRRQVGGQVSYTSFGRAVRASDNAVRSWLKVLSHLFYCFEIRPWSKNIANSLVKEPKYYLYDWSMVSDESARAENFVASHLLKAVHFWTDTGIGEFGLHYIRDKQQREVDFLVSRDDKPWMLVEVKYADGKKISSNLLHFHKALQPEYTVQTVIKMPYQDTPALVKGQPVIAPARTFLSQLI